MDLSIVIVNWNSKDYLAEALASVVPIRRDPAFAVEVVVIDSGSFDGCAGLLARDQAGVRFIQSEQNIGFARANNEAARFANGDVLLFLNPDTEVIGDAVQRLYRAVVQIPEVGIVGPKLLNSNGSVQETCIRAFPTLLNQLLDSDLLRTRFPRSGLWGKRHLAACDASPKRVDAVSGASLMIRRSLFQAVGGFSADYFMYSEDMDLCLKVRRAGFETCYIPDAVVVHHGGGSSQTSPSTFAAVMRLESQWRFFRKMRSPAYAALYRAAMFVASALRIAAALLAWPARAVRGESGWVRPVVLKWAARLRWAAGGERWVRKY